MTTVDQRPPVSARGSMRTLDARGDTEITWDPANPDEVAAAREHLDRMRDLGFLAYTVSDGGTRGDLIRELPPVAARVLITPPLAGG